MATYYEDILSQPMSLRRCMAAQTPDVLERLAQLCARPWQQVLFCGMGSSNYCAIPAVHYLAQCGRRASGVSASELLGFDMPALREDTLLVINSQSGESAEIVRLLRELPAGITVLAVSNDANSTLARAAALCLLMDAEPERSVTTRTYLDSLALCLLIARVLCGEPAHTAVQQVLHAADAMELALADAPGLLRGMTDVLGTPPFVCLLGRGCNHTTACAGTLFLREVARHTAFCELCGEFRHGPMEMVEEGFHAVIAAANDHTFALQCRLAQDIQSHGGKVVVITSQPVEGVPTILLPDVGPWLSPLLTILPIQLYADHLAAVKGLEAGAFRWGGKITRIE